MSDPGQPMDDLGLFCWRLVTHQGFVMRCPAFHQPPDAQRNAALGIGLKQRSGAISYV